MPREWDSLLQSDGMALDRFVSFISAQHPAHTWHIGGAQLTLAE